MNHQIRAIIIEDEPLSQQLLRTLLQDYCPQVQILGIANNVQEGVQLINTIAPELVFLDIEMPQENGLQLFKYFNPINFEVIFTTAYNKYAIDAIRLAALDYLQKPIGLIELQAALQRFQERKLKAMLQQAAQYDFLVKQTSTPNQALEQPKRVVLSTSEGYIFIDIENIMRCQSDKSYTLFVMNDGVEHWVSKSLKEYSDLLENFGFKRVHRSHLINPRYVQKLTRTKTPMLIMQDGAHIKVSPSKRDGLFEDLANLP